MTQLFINASALQALQASVGKQNVVALGNDSDFARKWMDQGYTVYTHSNGCFYAVKKNVEKVPAYFTRVL